MALIGQIPDREAESEFMQRYGASREDEDAIFVAHSKIEELDFPSSI